MPVKVLRKGMNMFEFRSAENLHNTTGGYSMASADLAVEIK